MMVNRNKILHTVLCTSVSAGAMVAPPLSTNANAQALTPLVDVCTGISLDDSVLTDVLNNTVVPTAGAVEGLYDTLLGTTILGIPVLSILDVDLNVAATTTALASGDPISLQILDTDNNLVAPGDCNITTDGYALNDPAGISIGGNSITGLGDGLAASAGDIDSIAFGNNAQTTGAATGSIALGTNAYVEVANSLALGMDSQALRGGQTYSAPGLVGSVTSVGEVSVGSAGNERQITNVAAASAATDATNLGQVQGLIAEVAGVADLAVAYDSATRDVVTLEGATGTTITNVADGALSGASTDAVNGSQLFATNTAVATNTTDIADLQALAVQYDDVTQDTVTLGGASGTTITNVADGALNATSTDAVNGSQLFATNQAVADLDGRVTTNETDIANLQTSVTNQQTTITDYGNQITQNETDISNLDARVTVNEGDIVNLDNRVTTNTTNIASVQTQVDNVPVRFVQDGNPTLPSATPTNTAAFYSSSGDATTVTNVAAGALDATSTDAVNGSQLYATNQQVAQNRTDIDNNTAAITNINNNIAGSTIVAVQYSDPGTPTLSNGGTVTQDVTLVGVDAGAPVALHNVANATLANDAVNLGQMQAGLQGVLAESMTYTDQRLDLIADRIDGLAFDLADFHKDASAGTASALAVAGIPQTMDPDKSMFGMAFGEYRGELGFAIGASTAVNDGGAVLKAGATWNTRGIGGFTAGAGFSF